MASDAGVGASVKIAQVTHAAGNFVGVRKIFARVRAQQCLRYAMTTVAGNAFRWIENSCSEFRRSGREGSVAHGALGALRGVGDVERFGDAFGTGGDKSA